jgi:putative tricarboxylic transport membrane protein
MNFNLLAGLGACLIGVLYSLQALTMRAASLGNPMAPKILPLMLGGLMILFGISQTIQALKKTGFKLVLEKGTATNRYVNIKILWTCAIALIYALLFDRLGYVLSTVLFLGGILTLFSGKEKWQRTVTVSVTFSVLIFVVFTKFLGIILPPGPIPGL